jgi:hypothetical protein
MSVSILTLSQQYWVIWVHRARAVVSYFEIHIGNSEYLESRDVINWTRLGGSCSCMAPASRTAGRRSHNGRDITRKTQNGEASKETSRW